MTRSSFKFFNVISPYEVGVISRSSLILPIHLGKTYMISNGKLNYKVLVQADMLYYKFGDFVYTKKRCVYKNKKKKRKK